MANAKTGSLLISPEAQDLLLCLAPFTGVIFEGLYKIEFNDRYEHASTYHQLGMVAQDLRNWEQAERYFKQAIEIYVDFDDPYRQADCYNHLGIVAEEQLNWEQCERYYKQALEIEIEFNDRYEQAGTYNNLGILTYIQQKWEQSRVYMMNALEIFIEFDDKRSAGIILGFLNRIWKDNHDDTIPSAVAAILGVNEEEAKSLLEGTNAD